MLKLTPILLSVLVLLVVSTGCAPAGSPTPDPGFISTAVAQTIAAGPTQAAPSATPAAIGELPTDTPTLVPELPTLTPTPVPVFTSTSTVPQISVSVPTNCRVGPGKVYDRTGSLLVGEVAEVLGRNTAGNYWYIRNPDASGGFCWLWGEYATVTGNTSTLPVYAPPASPTPSPAFVASYDDLDTCVGWWVEFELKNTGGIPFKSMSLTVRDTVTDVVVSVDTDEFTNVNGCLTTNARDTLEPGAVRRVSAPAFAYDPTGHQLRATITLCTGNGQKGTCTTQIIKFKP
jgi:hypothetical protein